MAADTGIADDGATLLNLPSVAQQTDVTVHPSDSADGDFTFDEILRHLIGSNRSHKNAHKAAGRDALALSDLAAPATDLAMAGHKLTGLGTPTAGTDAVTKTYADALIAANDAMVFKGVIDCSANPNYPAASRGDTYRVSVAGKIGGGSGSNVEAGDLLICLTDGTVAGTQAAVGASWTIAQANVDGAVTGPASSTDNNLASFNGAGGKVIKDSGLALDTDTALAANSDVKIPSQKAVKGYVDTATGLLVPKSLFDANTILVATTDDTPAALTVPASTVVGRKASGGIVALSISDLQTLLAGAITSAMITDGTIVDADISAGAAIAASKLNIAGARQVPVNALCGFTAISGAWTPGFSTALYKGCYNISANAVGDAISWPVGLDAGTWTMDLFLWKQANGGLYTVKLDGVSLIAGPPSAYAAVGASAQVTQAGIVVATSGLHTLRVDVTGTGAGGNQNIYLIEFIFTRTA